LLSSGKLKENRVPVLKNVVRLFKYYGFHVPEMQLKGWEFCCAKLREVVTEDVYKILVTRRDAFPKFGTP